MTDTEKLIDDVLTTRDINRLYQLDIECSQDIAVLKKRATESDTINEQEDAKGRLLVYHSILSVIKNRIPDLRLELESERQQEESKDYKFRMAAKYIISQEDYAKVMAETKLFAKDIRKKANNHK